MIVMDTI